MSHRITMFDGGFHSSPWMDNSVGPKTLQAYSFQVENHLKEYANASLPPGYVGTSPQVLKVLDGEYLIYGDGTAQFYSINKASWGPRFEIP